MLTWSLSMIIFLFSLYANILNFSSENYNRSISLYLLHLKNVDSLKTFERLVIWLEYRVGGRYFWRVFCLLDPIAFTVTSKTILYTNLAFSFKEVHKDSLSFERDLSAQSGYHFCTSIMRMLFLIWLLLIESWHVLNVQF